jgi:hypothetical protein
MVTEISLYAHKSIDTHKNIVQIVDNESISVCLQWEQQIEDKQCCLNWQQHNPRTPIVAIDAQELEDENHADQCGGPMLAC